MNPAELKKGVSQGSKSASVSSKSAGQKQSAVIKPGTGSGIGVKAGSTMTPMSHPQDKHGLGRRPSSKVLK